MPLSIRLICNSVHFSKILHTEIESYGLELSDQAENIILVESALGIALTELENSEIDPSKVIVFTPNPCPEYWQDVLEMGVLGLVVSSLNESMVLAAVEALNEKREFRRLPHVQQATLTIQERDVLRFAARSFSNKDIGDMLGKSEKTITNNITSILEKLTGTYPELRLNNRGCLVHYYYGFWNNIGKNCEYLRIAKENRIKKRTTNK
jgi:DNA-binding CsgD family transcriptional regulator